jgi:NADPH-dependent 2,4-dienoyl-CoA reductase/sulfur reductase-like enzyme
VVAVSLKNFFIREEWFWPIALDRREAQWISDRMAQHGVEVHLEHDVEALETGADGNVSAVRTNLGRYESDCVVIGIGVTPNTAWLADTAIELDERGGIVVDEGLHTSAPDVFAAGDCASVRWFDGTRRPEQLWYTARDQGRVAGGRLLGDMRRYERGTWYNSAKLMDIEYTTAGLVNWNLEREADWFFEETGKVRSTTRIVVQDDHVVGFNMLGRRWDHTVLIRWIEERRSLDWVLVHLNDAAFDTELVPPLQVRRA